MKIPTHNPQPAIDYCEFIEDLEEKYGWNVRDMAGKWSKEAREEHDTDKKKWMADNGYGGKWHVLNKPEGSTEDWPRDSEEIKLRVDINTGYNKVAKVLERPYQDFWHWLLNNDFIEFRRGGYNYLYLGKDEDWDRPDWVIKILAAIKEEVKDHPAFDGERVNFYVDW